MPVFVAGLVQVEISEPEPGEGQYYGLDFALELEDRGVHPVGFLPGWQAQYPAGDHQVHEADHVTEVEDDDLAAPPGGPQRLSDEPPLELLGGYVGHVRSEDGGPEDLASHGQGGHVFGDDRHLRQLGHLGSFQKLIDVAGDPVLVHAGHNYVGGLADLAGHAADGDPVTGEAEHVYIVVRVAEGENALLGYPPPLAQELQGFRLRAFEAADLDVVRQAAGDEKPSGEGGTRIFQPISDSVGIVHYHELGRLFAALLEPARRGLYGGDARFSVAPEVFQRRGGIRRGDDPAVDEDAGVK